MGFDDRNPDCNINLLNILKYNGGLELLSYMSDSISNEIYQEVFYKLIESLLEVIKMYKKNCTGEDEEADKLIDIIYENIGDMNIDNIDSYIELLNEPLLLTIMQAEFIDTSDT